MSAEEPHKIGGNSTLPIFMEAGATIAINKSTIVSTDALAVQLKIATTKATQNTGVLEVQNIGHQLSEDTSLQEAKRLKEVGKLRRLLFPREDSYRHFGSVMEEPSVLHPKKKAALGDRVPTRRGRIKLEPINNGEACNGYFLPFLSSHKEMPSSYINNTDGSYMRGRLTPILGKKTVLLYK